MTESQSIDQVDAIRVSDIESVTTEYDNKPEVGTAMEHDIADLEKSLE